MGRLKAITLGRLQYNLGAAVLDAKRTGPDYLAHPSVIPVQKMAAEQVFSEVVKASGPNPRP
jgi:hypothetical protein